LTEKKGFTERNCGCGCAVHKVHNCLQTAIDVMPIDIGVLVVKICKYLHIQTGHVTHLNLFCDFVNIAYKTLKKLLQHGNNRFIYLLPITENILVVSKTEILLLFTGTVSIRQRNV
jgi:hypothetical protein